MSQKMTDIPITPEVLQLIAEVDEFKGRWEALRVLSPDRLQALQRVATIESIGSSTRIEGVSLTDREIETLLGNLSRQTLRSRDAQEVAGYAAAMDLVYQVWEQMALTENHLRQLHRVLLQESAKDRHHRGEYKKQPNHVVAFDAEGREIGVVFETASPFETPFEMERLVGETRRALDEKQTHPLLTIAAFVVGFLAIHPFQDGNGRLSRILTTLLLLRAGYGYVPYASLEAVIEDNKDRYYASLRKTQMTLKKRRPNWEPWVVFFLRCLKLQKDRLATKLERERVLAASLPELSVRILTLLREQGSLSSADLARLTGANRNTLKVRLRELVEAGQIERHGQARATWYTLLVGV